MDERLNFACAAKQLLCSLTATTCRSISVAPPGSCGMFFRDSSKIFTARKVQPKLHLSVTEHPQKIFLHPMIWHENPNPPGSNIRKGCNGAGSGENALS